LSELIQTIYIRKHTKNWVKKTGYMYVNMFGITLTFETITNCYMYKYSQTHRQIVWIMKCYIYIFANTLTIEWIKACYFYIYIFSQTHWKLKELRKNIYIHIHTEIWETYVRLYIFIYSTTQWKMSEFNHSIYIFANTDNWVN